MTYSHILAQDIDARQHICGGPSPGSLRGIVCKPAEDRPDDYPDKQLQIQKQCQNLSRFALSTPASLISLLDQVFAADSYANWKEKLDKYNNVFGMVQSTIEVTADTQAWADGVFTSIEHPNAGRVNLITAPGRFSKTPGGPRTAAPELGQHTEEVLIEIGYTWDDILRLKEEQVII